MLPVGKGVEVLPELMSPLQSGQIRAQIEQVQTEQTQELVMLVLLDRHLHEEVMVSVPIR